MSSNLLLSLVVPVFNEEEVISFFIEEVNLVFMNYSDIFLEFIFINDGSTDSTLEVLLKYQKLDQRIKVIDLSRNFGKEAALTAGLDMALGNIVVPIDVDLQDPPILILGMIEKWRSGHDVVLARRINRDSDTWLKRKTADWFYAAHNKIANPLLPKNVGDFRLMDKKVVDAIKQLPESRRFMKGLFAWVGFKTAFIDYSRSVRIAGASKFNGWKLWNFAIEGFTSFSIGPLKVWTYLGIVVSLMSFIFAAFIIFKVLIYGVDAPGYASLMVAVTFLGGLQLIGIGVIGEYLGRNYIESKRRPVYLVRQIYENEI